jgi:hypothetical protein
MTTAKRQYTYFENLERTIKIALAVYLFLFVAGTALLALGGSRMLAEYAFSSPSHGALLAAIALGLYALAAVRIRKVHWIGELHIWLDRKFFGFLFRSNEIIFQTLLFALKPAERDAADELAPDERERIAEAIFSQLAGNNHLFPTLLRSGIFRLWIWYWVTNYGTAIFSALTIVAFPVILLSTAAAAKTVFAAFWVLALGHLFMGLWLGGRLLRMTKDVAEDIVKSYSAEIAAILRAHLGSLRG